MRKCYCFNDDWRFYKKEGEAGTDITIPHTWNNLDGQDGGNDYYRGTCFYHKTFKKPELCPGDKVYLEFRGVNSSAEIILNGEAVGCHEGGYSTFRVNITELLKEENLLEVKVNNAPNSRVYPQRADFTFYGGIYRDVYLIIVPESHFDLDYHGGSGIKVTTEMKDRQATVKVKTYIEGDYETVEVTIAGIGSMEAVNHGREAEATFLIPEAHLWNGLSDPYLYSVTAELKVNDQVVDQVSTRFGCRTYEFDKELGFFLNGESYPLHGVSRHQDRKGVGNALTKEMHEEDMQIILGMGANSIRLAHYQHDPYFYDLCDEKGMIVWAEIPYISQHMPDGRKNSITQMTELIVQNHHHPSILCWGLSNEISLTGVTEDLIENHHILNDLAHRLDPSRVTVMAHLFMLETDSPLIGIPDIMSYNLYYGWYLGELSDNDHFLDGFHAKYPDKLIGLSEYGADANYRLQSAKPEKGDYSEQYQCVYHEHMLEMFAKRSYLWSTYAWNMFDFAADAREEACEPGVNHKGLVSFDRSVKKDAYYLYKAYWSEEKFVHLCGRRYVDRVEDITEVKVYSNLEKVSLYKDGAFLEEKQGSRIFLFQVPLEGEHELQVRSGDYAEIIRVRKVKEPNPEYYLKGVALHNWFDKPDIEVIPGYFSIRDKLEDINQVPEGKALIDMMLEQTSAMKGDMAKNVEITDTMKQMMNRFTVENLLKQAGEGVSPEMVVMLNRQLSKIRKP